jgi:hypothetical protein
MAKHRKKKSKTQYVVDPNINDSLGGQEPKYEGFSDGESRDYHINANGLANQEANIAPPQGLDENRPPDGQIIFTSSLTAQSGSGIGSFPISLQGTEMKTNNIYSIVVDSRLATSEAAQSFSQLGKYEPLKIRLREQVGNNSYNCVFTYTNRQKQESTFETLGALSNAILGKTFSISQQELRNIVQKIDELPPFQPRPLGSSYEGGLYAGEISIGQSVCEVVISPSHVTLTFNEVRSIAPYALAYSGLNPYNGTDRANQYIQTVQATGVPSSTIVDLTQSGVQSGSGDSSNWFIPDLSDYVTLQNTLPFIDEHIYSGTNVIVSLGNEVYSEENTAGAGSFGVGSGEQGFLTSSPATISASGGASTGAIGYQPYVNGLRAFFIKIICPPDVPPTPKGCTDPSAVNYDPQAVQDDGSCDYRDILGCNDPEANNYNPEATVDDGSCIYQDEKAGCTDPDAENYNSQADLDDGSCYYPEDLGCTYPNADNYDPNAQVDDGSCTYTDVTNPDEVYGCTYQDALNYNPTANVDDGSCEFPDSEYAELVDEYDGGDTIIINQFVVQGVPLVLNFGYFTFYFDCPTNDGGVEVVQVPSDELFEEEVTVVVEEIEPIIEVEGCTDANAINYNPNADIDDGSCIAAVSGCTDPNANNYNPDANSDDGSCDYYVYGCTDPAAQNYNVLATFDDGSCVPAEEDTPEVYGCTNADASNYNPNATIDNGTCRVPVALCGQPNAANYLQNAEGMNQSQIGAYFNENGIGYPQFGYDDNICIYTVTSEAQPDLTFSGKSNANGDIQPPEPLTVIQQKSPQELAELIYDQYGCNYSYQIVIEVVERFYDAQYAEGSYYYNEWEDFKNEIKGDTLQYLSYLCDAPSYIYGEEPSIEAYSATVVSFSTTINGTSQTFSTWNDLVQALVLNWSANYYSGTLALPNLLSQVGDISTLCGQTIILPVGTFLEAADIYTVGTDYSDVISYEDNLLGLGSNYLDVITEALSTLQIVDGQLDSALQLCNDGDTAACSNVQQLEQYVQGLQLEIETLTQESLLAQALTNAINDIADGVYDGALPDGQGNMIAYDTSLLNQNILDQLAVIESAYGTGTGTGTGIDEEAYTNLLAAIEENQALIEQLGLDTADNQQILDDIEAANLVTQETIASLLAAQTSSQAAADALALAIAEAEAAEQAALDAQAAAAQAQADAEAALASLEAQEDVNQALLDEANAAQDAADAAMAEAVAAQAAADEAAANAVAAQDAADAEAAANAEYADQLALDQVALNAALDQLAADQAALADSIANASTASQDAINAQAQADADQAAADAAQAQADADQAAAVAAQAAADAAQSAAEADQLLADEAMAAAQTAQELADAAMEAADVAQAAADLQLANAETQEAINQTILDAAEALNTDNQALADQAAADLAAAQDLNNEASELFEQANNANTNLLDEISDLEDQLGAAAVTEEQLLAAQNLLEEQLASVETELGIAQAVIGNYNQLINSLTASITELEQYLINNHSYDPNAPFSGARKMESYMLNFSGAENPEYTKLLMRGVKAKAAYNKLDFSGSDKRSAEERVRINKIADEYYANANGNENKESSVFNTVMTLGLFAGSLVILNKLIKK